MRQVSDRFLASMRTTHALAVRARIVEPGQTGEDPQGVDVEVVDGDVQLQANSKIRGTLDITVDVPWPSLPTDPATPYGNEVFVQRGVDYGDGSDELVSLGYYRINTIEQASLPDGPLRFTCSDRMAGIDEAKLLNPVQFTANHTHRQVYERLILDVYPWAQIAYDYDPDALALGRAQVVEKDRWKFLDELVRSLGRTMYWDHRGILVVTTPPDPTVPVYTIDHGDMGVLTDIGRQIGRDGIYNGVVAEGEASGGGAPIRKIAVDNNSSSPTYWRGSYGQVVKFFRSPLMVDGHTTQRAANYELRKTIGLPYTIDLGTTPNPAIEPNDPITVVHRAGEELHVVDTVTVPLTAEAAMTIGTRQQTVDAVSGLGGE